MSSHAKKRNTLGISFEFLTVEILADAVSINHAMQQTLDFRSIKVIFRIKIQAFWDVVPYINIYILVHNWQCSEGS